MLLHTKRIKVLVKKEVSWAKDSRRILGTLGNRGKGWGEVPKCGMMPKITFLILLDSGGSSAFTAATDKGGTLVGDTY